MQPFNLSGDHTVASSQSADSINAALISALKSKNMDIQNEAQPLIWSSRDSFLGSIFRDDSFRGIKGGEIWITPTAEGQFTIHYDLDISSLGPYFAINMVGAIIAAFSLAFSPDSPLEPILYVLVIGIAFFFVLREWIRYEIKQFLSKTIKRSGSKK